MACTQHSDKITSQVYNESHTNTSGCRLSLLAYANWQYASLHCAVFTTASPWAAESLADVQTPPWQREGSSKQQQAFFEGRGQKELCLLVFSNWQSADKPPQPNWSVHRQGSVQWGLGEGGAHRLHDTHLRRGSKMASTDSIHSYREKLYNPMATNYTQCRNTVILDWDLYFDNNWGSLAWRLLFQAPSKHTHSTISPSVCVVLMACTQHAKLKGPLPDNRHRCVHTLMRGGRAANQSCANWCTSSSKLCIWSVACERNEIWWGISDQTVIPQIQNITSIWSQHSMGYYIVAYESCHSIAMPELITF